MSFDECLFLQGVIKKQPKEAHKSDLHREINPTMKKNNLEDSGRQPCKGEGHLG
jgi:hypothetical protein